MRRFPAECNRQVLVQRNISFCKHDSYPSLITFNRPGRFEQRSMESDAHEVLANDSDVAFFDSGEYRWIPAVSDEDAEYATACVVEFAFDGSDVASDLIHVDRKQQTRLQLDHHPQPFREGPLSRRRSAQKVGSRTIGESVLAPNEFQIGQIAPVSELAEVVDDPVLDHAFCRLRPEIQMLLPVQCFR